VHSWYCPVCGLDFRLRTELEAHVRDNHCAVGPDGPAGGVEQLPAGAVFDWQCLREFQAATDNPSVSLLVPTTPARAMTPPDREQLAEMARQARRRLAVERDGAAPHPGNERLEVPVT
jgi:hypothetical protein